MSSPCCPWLTGSLSLGRGDSSPSQLVVTEEPRTQVLFPEEVSDGHAETMCPVPWH